MKFEKILNQLAENLRRKPKGLEPYDLAVGAHEDLFNNFLTAHHKIEYHSPNTIYKGKGAYADLRLEFAYDIPDAAALDLAPLVYAKRESKRQLLSLPPVFKARKSKSVQLLLDASEANVKIRVPEIRLSLKIDGMSKPVVFNYAFNVLARVEIDTNKDLRFTPIKGEVEDPAAIEKALAKLEKHNGIREVPTCYEVMDLIRHLINVTIANRISSFIQVIDLPSIVKIIEGFGLGDFDVQVIESFIVVTAKAITPPSSTMARIPTYAEVKAHLEEEIAAVQHKVNARLSGASIARLTPASSSLPDRWLFAFLTLNLFQQAANAALNFEGGSGDSGKELGFVEWEWGLRYYIRNPRLSFVGNELFVDLDAGGSAFARARADTCCGHTPWFGVSAKFTPRPEARLRTKFYVKDGNMLLMSAGARPMWLIVEFGGLGWPLDLIISAILTAILTFLNLVGNIIGARWTMELVKLPNKFPGTAIPAKGELDRNIPVVDRKHLAVTGKVRFG